MDLNYKNTNKLDVHPDHFIEENGHLYAGNHYLIDMWGCDYLEDDKKIKEFMIGAAEIAGATILYAHTHHFGEGQGISGVVVLAESHISIHTWPERNYAAFDIFMCGNTNPDASLAFLRNNFKPNEINVKKIKRGLVSQKK
ncbi:MAG: adenosylmethionine decarboxylase [Pelagibacterales bacterium]|jgi:S-adenosylmethionine decarboxylase|nr:adenosylmethionine decarboxylase [Pelagibacterales bacterium]